MSDHRANEVLGFWFGEGAERSKSHKRWFEKNAAFDAEIRSRFLPLYEELARRNDWLSPSSYCLARIVVLDQFPRNMFRGDKLAFATDPLARAIAAGAIVRGFDSQVSPDLRSFFYLPFEHSEDLADQERGIAFYKAAGDTENLKWAEIHADIIRRFGRFPHRNALLGRTTTPEEQAFLDGGGFAG